MPDNECAIVELLLLLLALPLLPLALLARTRLSRIPGGPPTVFNAVIHPFHGNGGLFVNGLLDADGLRPDNRKLYREPNNGGFKFAKLDDDSDVSGFRFAELNDDDDDSDTFDTGSHSISSEYEFDELLTVKLLVFEVDDGFKLLTASKLFN